MPTNIWNSYQNGGSKLPPYITPFFSDDNAPSSGDSGQTGNSQTTTPPATSGTVQQQGSSSQAQAQGQANGQGSGSSTSTTTTTREPVYKFSGNNYAELEDFIRQQMKENPPESLEEREKREKREKSLGFLARLADGLGTLHTAYSYARGVKAMDMPNFTAKTQERIDKAKAERERNQDRYLNYAIQLGNLKDKQQDFAFRVQQANQQQSNWQDQFDAGRQDRKDDVAYRDKAYNDSRKDRADDVAFRDKQFDEGKRQFNANLGLQRAQLGEQARHNRASEGLQARSLSIQQQGNNTRMVLGNGQTLTLPNSSLNSHNISYVFGKLSPYTQETAGDPIIGQFGPTGEYKTPTVDQMLEAIGRDIGNNPAAQNAWRHVGGQFTSDLDNTPPSLRRRDNNSNTPPSRR